MGSEMSSHDELHDHGMLGATESLINLVSEMKMHDELHEKPHMLGAVLNPFHVSKDAPVHGFKDIKIVNKRNDLTGYDVKPKMLINLSEMSSHDELHEKPHMLGAMAPELINLLTEM